MADFFYALLGALWVSETQSLDCCLEHERVLWRYHVQLFLCAAWFGDMHVCEIMDLDEETVQKDRFLTDVCSLVQ